MNAELMRRARETKFWRGGLSELAGALPADDAELRDVLLAAVAERDELAFTHLVFAALMEQRGVPAEVLVEGAMLLPDSPRLAAAAWRMSGNVAEALVQAVKRGMMDGERNGMALLVSAGWCKARGRSDTLPSVITQARIQARNKFAGLETRLTLRAVAIYTGDDGLKAILATEEIPVLEDAARNLIRFATEDAPRALEPLVPKNPPSSAISGYTVRRAVARLGRNDPCHCGSGKKYKNCCLDKDHARLGQSSSVAGLTVAELREQRERYLTKDEMLRMQSYELARLDPAKVAPDLLPLLVNQLLLFSEMDRVAKLFETVGAGPPLDGHWEDALHRAAMLHRPEIVERLLRLRPDLDPETADLRLEVSLGLKGKTENPALDLIESRAMAAVRENKTGDLMDIGHALLNSKWPALGILVARGIIPIANLWDAETLHEVALETRDRLNLSYTDPIDEIAELAFRRLWEPKSEDSAATARARQEIETKNREVQDLRAKLQEMRADLDRRERLKPPPAPAAAAASPAPPPAPDPEARELRQRMDELKESLKVRHAERNQLRRELQKAQQDITELRQKASSTNPPPETEPADGEDELFHAVEFESTQPVRLVEFPARFYEALRPLPKAVARATVLLAGRLASGEPGAFAGVKRLRLNTEIHRQRVGADYRLLFRLRPDAVQILALVNRRDLEKEIRNHFTS